MAAVPELNFLDYWRVVRKRKATIIFTSLLCVGGVLVHNAQQVPVYQASAKIMIQEQRSATSGDIEPYYAADFIKTQSRLITSYKVAEEAAHVLGWITEDMDADTRDGVISNIQGSVSTEEEADTKLVNILVTTDDPESAPLIANAVAKGFQRFVLKDRSAQASAVREFVGKQLEEVDARLKKKEEELKNFRQESEKHGSVDSMKAQLVQWESNLDMLLEKYTEQHPEVKEMRQRIASLRSRMGEYPKLEMQLSQLERAIKTDQDLYGTLKKRYEESRITEAETQSGVTIVNEASGVAPIMSSAPVNAILGALMGLFLGLVFAFVRENIDTSIGTIEEIEEFLGLPVLGVIPQIIPEGKKEEKKSRLPDFLKMDTRDELEIKDEARKMLSFETDTHSTSAEAYKTLRTNINFICQKKGLKVIMFTSSGSQEGKTITTANCALSMAQNGQKVLLVSADLRRGMVHHLFGLKREPGLSDILTRGTAPDDAIRRFTDLLVGQLSSSRILSAAGIDNLSILTEGRTPTNPAELLGSEEMRKLMLEMRERYDYVFLDCPPILPVADALLLGPKADGVIIVYHAGKTARGALKRSKVQLASVNANIIGVILNNIKASELKMGPSYYYYYGYGYGYYGERRPKPPWYKFEWLFHRRKKRKHRGEHHPPPASGDEIDEGGGEDGGEGRDDRPSPPPAV